MVTTDESSFSGELEAKSHNDFVPHEMFFAKEKHILVSLEKLATSVNAFTVCKFCSNPIQVEEDNDKSVGLACFLKMVCQNEMLKAQDKQLNQHLKQKWSIFLDQLSLLFCEHSRRKE